MKTIEERAKEYADMQVTEYNDPMYEAMREAVMSHYIAGARSQMEIDIAERITTARKFYMNGSKDQLKIDIEKACEYIKANVNDYIVEVGQDWHTDNIVGSDFIADFRKAMEEELWQ